MKALESRMNKESGEDHWALWTRVFRGKLEVGRFSDDLQELGGKILANFSSVKQCIII